MPTDPIAPAWIVLPLALIALIVQAGYLIALKELPKKMMPPSRRRIRTASGWLSMFAIPLIAYGFGIATMDDPRMFTVIWMVVIGLISGILMLAGLDAINSIRLHRKVKSQLTQDFRDAIRIDRGSGDEDG